MLRFIDIWPDGKTTIERFPLEGDKSFWLAKKVIDNETTYGAGETKDEAISELAYDRHYAELGCPNWLPLPGNQLFLPVKYFVFSIPGAHKFIASLLGFELRQSFKFQVIYCEDTNSIAMVCIPTINEAKSAFVLFTSGGAIQDQIRACVYQLYIEYDTEIDFKLKIEDKNVKKRQWLSYWYKRLPARGF